jgi:hypothetical protein
MTASTRSSGPALALLFSVQVLCVSAAALLPFGFDHPSSLGLHFGHLLALASAYLVALLAGLVLAARRRRWKLLLGELALPTFVRLPRPVGRARRVGDQRRGRGASR